MKQPQLTRRRFFLSSSAALVLPACAREGDTVHADAACPQPEAPPPVDPASLGVDPWMGHAPGDLRLNKNENPFGPSPRALEAIRASADQSHRYVRSSIIRERLAERHQVSPDMVRLGTGSGEILRMLPFMFAREGGNVIAARQAYRATPSVAEAIGLEVRWIDLRPDFGYALDEMLAAVDADTRIFYLVNPNNPTGTSLPAAEITRIVDALPPEVLVVIDEAYVDFLPEGYGDALSLVQAGRPNLLITRTFSKAYGLAGLRIGYGLAAAPLVERISAMMMTGPNVAAYAGALAALDDTEHVRRTVAHARACRSYFGGALEQLGLEHVLGDAPLLMVKLGDRVGEAVAALEQQGIFIRDGRSWELPQWVRISYGLEAQNAQVVEALRSYA